MKKKREREIQGMFQLKAAGLVNYIFNMCSGCMTLPSINANNLNVQPCLCFLHGICEVLFIMQSKSIRSSLPDTKTDAHIHFFVITQWCCLQPLIFSFFPSFFFDTTRSLNTFVLLLPKKSIYLTFTLSIQKFYALHVLKKIK